MKSFIISIIEVEAILEIQVDLLARFNRIDANKIGWIVLIRGKSVFFRGLNIQNVLIRGSW